MDINALCSKLISGDRRALAKAITLTESVRADHQLAAQTLLQQLPPQKLSSHRIGISGPPGVGKSTFIEALGLHAAKLGHKVAVLAIDPSSPRSGGAILGDKTRMEKLAQHPHAFVRPTPARGELGGAAEYTREAIRLCEAADFDIVIVETVGVGQSEVEVVELTDSFVLLQLPNAGDELQGLKRGVLELANLVVVNKLDIDKFAAQRSVGELKSALGYYVHSNHMPVEVLMASALHNEGINEIWQFLQTRLMTLQADNSLKSKRQEQINQALSHAIRSNLITQFYTHPAVQKKLPIVQQALLAGTISVRQASQELLNIFNDPDKNG